VAALALTNGGADSKVDKHPERRFKAAYAAYEERELERRKLDGSADGLRQNQLKDRIRRDFDRAPENPFNQLTAAYDANAEQVREVKAREREKVEARLAG
jgi:hypothetical protein